MKNLSIIWDEELRLQLQIHGDNGFKTNFKITIDPYHATFKSERIHSDDGESLSLEVLLVNLIEGSFMIRSFASMYRSEVNPEIPKFYVIRESSSNCRISSKESCLGGEYEGRPLSEFREIHLSDKLSIDKKLTIDRYTFNTMLVVVYNKIENDKAPIDIDDDIEDYDNYFKAYSNTKFTKESLRKLLEMSGADPTASDD